MLLELSVKNFAIIEDLTLKFNDGMTVLTGETGAGKSLIIDTISLLLGARADSDMIRYNEKKAIIKGVFTHNSLLDEIFKKNSINILDTITVYREIIDSSRNVIKINDSNVTLQFLKNISIYLADIHIQNDTYKLFNPEIYLSFIDPKGDKTFDKIMSEYSKSLYDYLDKYKVYDKIVLGNKNLKDKLEFLEYEKNELEALELYEGIDKELEDKVNKLSNFDKINNSLSEAYNLLSSDNGGLDIVYEAAKALDNISSYDDKFREYSEKLMDLYYISGDIKDEVIKELTSTKGIGQWTAKMFLIFVLNRNDVLPYKDAAFLQSFRLLYIITETDTATVKKKCHIETVFLSSRSIDISSFRYRINKKWISFIQMLASG